LRSVYAQTHAFKDCLLVDNASSDGSVELVRRLFPDLKILVNAENLGFSRAANQGIAATSGDFILLLNPDVVLQSDYVDRLMRCAEAHPSAGSFGGKLLRMQGANLPPMIDSAGLVLLQNKRRPWDRGFGEADRGQLDRQEEVFGINGAAVCYRRSMLEDVKLDGDYFDTGFFIYFEDVDLAWRAQIRGWKSIYEPQAVAHHARGGLQGGKNPVVRIHAAKNRYLVYFKNESLFARRLLPNLAVELLRLGAYAVREPISLLGFFRFLGLIPKYLRIRKRIQTTARVHPEDLLRWYC
jgi:GT2 family glycosyltransferase